MRRERQKPPNEPEPIPPWTDKLRVPKDAKRGRVNKKLNDKKGDFAEEFLGPVLKGTIIEQIGNDVIVEVGLKSEGVVDVSEFDSPDEISPGKEIEVILEDTNSEGGLILLSKRKADRIRDRAITEKDVGQMEMICDDPRIMIDGAHNAASIQALIHAIGQNIPYDSMVIIFGCNNDKDTAGMLDKLQYGADKVIFTRSNSAKAMSPEELAEIYTEICGKVSYAVSSLGEALQMAKDAVSKEDLICITGSFDLVKEAKNCFHERVSNKMNFLPIQLPSGLKVYIDPGNASKETLQEVFEAISGLHIAAGGLGLEFVNDNNFIYTTEKVTT
ncbi:MAG: cyanophycin synthetase [Phycisphaerae bacterium]|jgi:hypothetical protein